MSIALTGLLMTGCTAGPKPGAAQAVDKASYRLVDPQGWAAGSRRFAYASASLTKTALPIFKAGADKCPARYDISWADPPYEICAQHIRLLRGGHINAYTDGPYIYLTEGAARLSENWLAFLIAHELAHTTLGHDIENGSQADLELEADAEAIRLMTAAGYDPRTVPLFIRQTTAGMDEPSDTHPSTQQRLDVVTAAIKVEGLPGYSR